MLTGIAGKYVCLNFGKSMAVIKEIIWNCSKIEHGVEATESRRVKEESNISKEICQFMKCKGKDSAAEQRVEM